MYWPSSRRSTERRSVKGSRRADNGLYGKSQVLPCAAVDATANREWLELATFEAHRAWPGADFGRFSPPNDKISHHNGSVTMLSRQTGARRALCSARHLPFSTYQETMVDIASPIKDRSR
jgi:hypothetical protein